MSAVTRLHPVDLGAAPAQRRADLGRGPAAACGGAVRSFQRADSTAPHTPFLRATQQGDSAGCMERLGELRFR